MVQVSVWDPDKDMIRQAAQNYIEVGQEVAEAVPNRASCVRVKGATESETTRVSRDRYPFCTSWVGDR